MSFSKCTASFWHTIGTRSFLLNRGVNESLRAHIVPVYGQRNILREVELLAQGHATNELHSQDVKPGLSDLKN